MRRRTTQHHEDQHLRQTLLRPPDRTLKQKVRDIFWDPINKTCLTRTPINWLSITVYYIIFLSCVILTFSTAMVIVYYCMNVTKPQYLLGDSPIGTTPCLNYFPRRGSRSLIWLSPKNSYDSYVESINKVFKSYEGLGKNFSTEDFGDCAKPPFGYDKKTPCIFFRLNRLISWKPTPYGSGDALPLNVPTDVKISIAQSSTPKIWVHCEGTTAKDRDHIPQTFFQFQGSSGFNISVYPYDMQSDFMDPIVALKLNATDQKKLLYSFFCTAWSKKMDAKKSRVDVNFYME